MFEESPYVLQEILVSLQKADMEVLGGDVDKWIETARQPSSTRGGLVSRTPHGGGGTFLHLRDVG